MIQMLGRKQRIPNERWQEAMDKIEELVSPAELEKAVKAVKADIRKHTNGKKAAYC